MSPRGRLHPVLLVLLGGAALQVQACTSLLGTFEIGSGSGGGGGGAGGGGGDPSTSTGVGSTGSGTPQGASVFVPAASTLFAHATTVSSTKSVIAVGGSFSGAFDVNGKDDVCSKAKSCGFVARFNPTSDPSPTPAWLIPLEGDGATDTAEIHSVAVDAQGDIYVAGSYSGSLRINTQALLPEHFSDGLQHAFLLRLGADGAPQGSLVNQAGGASVAASVAVAPDGTVLVGGDFTAAVKLGVCGTLTINAGGRSSFINKLSPDLGTCLWLKPLVGPDVKLASIAADAGGNALITGSHTVAIGFIGGVSLPTSKAPGGDMFVAKLDGAKQGAALWMSATATTVGAAGVGVAQTQDSQGNFGIMVTGKLAGQVFANTPCATTAAPGAEGFVARFDDKTGACVWSKGFAGESTGIAVDGGGSLVLTGTFEGDLTFGGSSLLTAGPGQATFAAKLDTVAGKYLWSRGLVVANKGEKIAAAGVASDYASGHWVLAGTLDGTTDFGVGPARTAADGSFMIHLGN